MWKITALSLQSAVAISYLGSITKQIRGNMKGLDLVDLYTEQGEGRLIQNIVLQSELFDMPIVGFENHGGRTCINNNKPLGKSTLRCRK